MPAETAIRALLMQSSAITTLVGDRCHPVEVPIGMDLPALATRHISTVDAGTVDAAAPYSLQSSRIEVRAVAQSYPLCSCWPPSRRPVNTSAARWPAPTWSASCATSPARPSRSRARSARADRGLHRHLARRQQLSGAQRFKSRAVRLIP